MNDLTKILSTELDSEDEATTEESFVDSLTDNEILYVTYKSANPNISKSDLMRLIGCTRREVLAMESNVAIEKYLSEERRKVLKEFSDAHLERSRIISEYLHDEIMHRFEEARAQRLTPQKLMDDGYTHNEAKLILASRVEGASLKDLAMIAQEIPKTVSKLRESEVSDDTNTLEQIGVSNRFMKYEAQILNVNFEHFATSQAKSVDTFSGARVNEIYDTEIVENEDE